MKILFDLRSTGLGNGGGSQTLVKSANTLYELGHDIKIIDSSKNQHTWNKLEVIHKIIKNENDIPDADIIISTGFKSVPLTLKLPKRCGKKLVWIRGWELWIYDENKIVESILKQPIIKIVNSVGLYNKLKEYNTDSYVIRPGNDLEIFYNLNLRKSNKIIIGGLYHDKHRKTKRVDWILETYRKLKEKYSNLELWMMGSSDPVLYDLKLITKYFKQPTVEEKNKFYNNIHIWLSTSELEGLHITPAEAMMTECCVVGTKAPLSGTQDYLISKDTGFVSENNIKDFIKCVDKLIKDKNLREELGKNGREKIIALGDRSKNMSKFINLIEMLLNE